MDKKLLRRSEVEKITGLSRTSIYRMMNDNEFPRPLRIGKRSVAWREVDLTEWLENLPSTSAA